MTPVAITAAQPSFLAMLSAFVHASGNADWAIVFHPV